MDSEKQELLDNMIVTLKNHSVDADFVKLWDYWIKALRQTRQDLTAYLLYMTVRLLEMKRILKHTCSIYLHCDPTASHYIKVLMDGIFGHKNFRNEIIWCYKTGGASKKHFSKKHDTIFFYSKSEKYFFENLKEKSYHGLDYSTGNKKVKLYKDDKYKCLGPYTIVNAKDWWNISFLGTSSKERLGYPTQKPLELLDRIIHASCPEGGTILDPFCGCGTTIYSAHLNNKKWIGIDIAILSTRLVQDTLNTRYDIQEGTGYEISGIPVSVEEAKYLFDQDHFQFQNWCIEQVEGFCTNKKNSGWRR